MDRRLVLSGPFCMGKSAILKRLWEEQGIPKILDDTTRPMRADEIQGYPYAFITAEEFRNRLRRGYYFEWVQIGPYQYGIPKEELERFSWSLDLLSGSWPRYRDRFPGVVGIYLLPPDPQELIRRARNRGDSEEDIALRLSLLDREQPQYFHHRIPPQTTLEAVYEQVLAYLR